MTTPPKGGSGSHNKHARLSPSASDRWMSCSASIEYIERLREEGVIPKKEPSNVYGAVGSFAHDLSEIIFNHLLGRKKSPEIEAHKTVHKWLKTKTLHHQKDYAVLENYIDYCMAQIRDKKDKVHIEVQSRLFYSEDPEEKGTCDFLIEHRDGDLTVIDLKWRNSGMVESIRNSQLAIYVKSYIQNRMFKKLKPDAKISIATYNPLVHPYAEPWEISVAEFNDFCREIQRCADIIDEGVSTVFVPSEYACKWCPAREVCVPKMMNLVNAIPSSIMDSPNGVPVLSEEALVEFWKLKTMLSDAMKTTEEKLQALAEKGTPAPGTKLITGRSVRRYRNEDEAASFLRRYLDESDIYKRSIESFSNLLPQLPKSIQKRFEKDHLIKPKGAPKVALDTDKRPTSKSLKSALFKNIRKSS